MPKQERGQNSSEHEDEKPLKKARYVWEIKGKYHLKESHENNVRHSKNNIIDPHSCKTKIDNESMKLWHETSDKKDEAWGSRNCCIESFISRTEALIDSDMEDEEFLNNNSLTDSFSNEIPLTLVSAKPKDEEYYMQKWQAKKMARGFVDNTINNVLESLLNPPQDAADFVDSCAEDGQVEDDAIMMAIQYHGLQSGSARRAFQIEESTRENIENSQTELIREHECNSSWSDTVSVEQNNLDGENPMDFLNAAVLVAIQKKGLSYN